MPENSANREAQNAKAKSPRMQKILGQEEEDRQPKVSSVSIGPTSASKPPKSRDL